MTYSFVDLFAGIGGMNLALSSLGMHCVYANDHDLNCRIQYDTNFGRGLLDWRDIRSVSTERIPDHDILCAGFPCPSFSLGGVAYRKSAGFGDGLDCEKSGRLFYEVARVIEAKKPRAFLLENVKNLVMHDKGRTLQTILSVLEDELGYSCSYTVLDSSRWVPQKRERVYIVGFRDRIKCPDITASLPTGPRPVLASILHAGENEPIIPGDWSKYYDHDARRVQLKYVLSQALWDYMQQYYKKKAESGNRSCMNLLVPSMVANTMTARYGKDGAEILIVDEALPRPRKLTPRESARLMGFPDDYKIVVSDRQAWTQFGNSVVVPTVRAVASGILQALNAG